MSRVKLISLQAGVNYARLYTRGEPDISMFILSPHQETAWREALAPFELHWLTGEVPSSSEIEQSARIMEAVMPGQVMAYYNGRPIWPVFQDWVGMILASTLNQTEIAGQLGIAQTQVQSWVKYGCPVPDEYTPSLRAILERAVAGFPLQPDALIIDGVSMIDILERAGAGFPLQHQVDDDN